MFPTKVSIEKGFKEHALWLFDTIDEDTLALHATNVVSVTMKKIVCGLDTAHNSRDIRCLRIAYKQYEPGCRRSETGTETDAP
jgi:hypothetical protein